MASKGHLLWSIWAHNIMTWEVQHRPNGTGTGEPQALVCCKYCKQQPAVFMVFCLFLLLTCKIYCSLRVSCMHDAVSREMLLSL